MDEYVAETKAGSTRDLRRGVIEVYESSASEEQSSNGGNPSNHNVDDPFTHAAASNPFSEPKRLFFSTAFTTLSSLFILELSWG